MTAALQQCPTPNSRRRLWKAIKSTQQLRLDSILATKTTRTQWRREEQQLAANNTNSDNDNGAVGETHSSSAANRGRRFKDRGEGQAREVQLAAVSASRIFQRIYGIETDDGGDGGGGSSSHHLLLLVVLVVVGGGVGVGVHGRRMADTNDNDEGQLPRLPPTKVRQGWENALRFARIARSFAVNPFWRPSSTCSWTTVPMLTGAGAAP